MAFQFRRGMKVRTLVPVHETRSAWIEAGTVGTVQRHEGKYAVVAFAKPFTDGRGITWLIDEGNRDRDNLLMNYLESELKLLEGTPT